MPVTTLATTMCPCGNSNNHRLFNGTKIEFHFASKCNKTLTEIITSTHRHSLTHTYACECTVEFWQYSKSVLAINFHFCFHFPLSAFPCQKSKFEIAKSKVSPNVDDDKMRRISRRLVLYSPLAASLDSA